MIVTKLSKVILVATMAVSSFAFADVYRSLEERTIYVNDSNSIMENLEVYADYSFIEPKKPIGECACIQEPLNRTPKRL